MNQLRTYAQLVRLPNVFTALADICLGGLALWAVTEPDAGTGWGLSWACLLASSACLYSAGMVWNDYFDLGQDRRERPFRPLPSGRVRPTTAAQLGTILILAGLVWAGLAGWRPEGLDWTPLILAAVLAAAIFLYDGWLKRTWAGPLGMGTCRFSNVLLGLSGAGVAAVSRWPWGIHMALVVGIYIVGVTWFARTEARTSQRSSLRAAGGVMLAALILALPLPLWFPAGMGSPVFLYLLVGLGFLLGIPVGNAIRRPSPAQVQAAVKRAIFGLVVLDATLATAVAGTVGLVILVLLLPALYLGRWIDPT